MMEEDIMGMEPGLVFFEVVLGSTCSKLMHNSSYFSIGTMKILSLEENI